MAKKALKTKAIAAPQTIEDLIVWLRDVGEEQRSLDAIETEINTKIEAVKAPYDDIIAERLKKREVLLVGIQAFAESHREEILPKGSKTLSLETGIVAWRTTPPKVTIKDEKEVIKQIQKLKLDKFLRVTTNVDKEAMLKEKDVATAIAGVTISQGEDFIVKPSQTSIEYSVAKGKAKVVPQEKEKKETRTKKPSKKVPA